MTQTGTASEATEGRKQAHRLRSIAGRASSASRRGLNEIFDLGAGFEEAAGILKGSFGAWLTSQCGFEPRTALGYRKAHRHLADRREWLAENEVSPSVAVLIASAPLDARERCLEAIGSGRKLTASQTRAIVREARGRSPAPGTPELLRAARAGADELVERIRRLATLFEEDRTAGRGRLEDAQAEAANILPVAEILLAPSSAPPARKARTTSPPAHPVLRFLDELATTRDWQALERAGRALRDELEVPAPARAPAVAARTEDAAAIQSVHSGFRHGLTAVELCAGGGGQAAGIARAGFRHLALVERNPAACRTLRAAFGADHVVEGDLADYAPSPADLGPVDLLAGGIPCQPYSRLGEMGGKADSRDLFPEALRLVEALRPRAILLENVDSIFYPRFDLHRFEILARLERAGYTCQWRHKIDARDFGVPQARVRSVLVAFREPEAMARFRWPMPVAHPEEEPPTVYRALHSHLVARGFEPSEALERSMDRPAPTITGGSDRKQGANFGMPKASAVWGEIGFVEKRIGREPPAAGHEGPILATNAMLARLQAFPAGWPFTGGHARVFKQVANAFPPPVALHLGCAIAAALTGERQDPGEQDVYEAMRLTMGRQARLRAATPACYSHPAPSRNERPKGRRVRLVPPHGRHDGVEAFDLDPPGRLDERPPAWQRPIKDWEIDMGEPAEEPDAEATAPGALDAGEADPGALARAVS